MSTDRTIRGIGSTFGGNMSDFGDGQIVRARKQHCCEWCHTAIVVGERHFRFCGKWQREFQDWRMHNECEDAHSRETYEGEICDAFHQRGRTCADTEEERRKFKKELGEIIKKAVHAHGIPNETQWTRIAHDVLHEVEEWQYGETNRVNQLKKAVVEENRKLLAAIAERIKK